MTMHRRGQVYVIACAIIAGLCIMFLSDIEPLYIQVVEKDYIVMAYQLESVMIEAIAYGSSHMVLENEKFIDAFMEYFNKSLSLIYSLGIVDGNVDRVTVAVNLTIRQELGLRYLATYEVHYSYDVINHCYIVKLDVLNVKKKGLYPRLRIRYYHYSTLTPNIKRHRSIKVIGGIVMRVNETTYDIVMFSKRIIIKDDLGVFTFISIED